jgi:hypothetical protein
MRRDPDQGDLFSTAPSSLAKPDPSGRARGSGVGPTIQSTMAPSARPTSKSHLAVQEAAARRWRKRQRREQDKREGITPGPTPHCRCDGDGAAAASVGHREAGERARRDE